MPADARRVCGRDGGPVAAPAARGEDGSCGARARRAELLAGGNAPRCLHLLGRIVWLGLKLSGFLYGIGRHTHSGGTRWEGDSTGDASIF